MKREKKNDLNEWARLQCPIRLLGEHSKHWCVYKNTYNCVILPWAHVESVLASELHTFRYALTELSTFKLRSHHIQQNTVDRRTRAQILSTLHQPTKQANFKNIYIYVHVYSNSNKSNNNNKISPKKWQILAKR